MAFQGAYTSNGVYMCSNGQPREKPALADAPIFIHRRDDDLIAKVIGIKHAAKRMEEERERRPQDSYYHS